MDLETVLMREVTAASAPAVAPPPKDRAPRPEGTARQPPEASVEDPTPHPPTKPSTGLAGLLWIGVLGVAVRVWLLASPLGYLNSDEAHTSIQARELFRGHAWILVPGTPYGGNVEAWIDAPLAALLGLSATRNKVEAILLWLVAGLVLARSVRHLGRGPVAAAFGVVWLPSAAIVLLSTLDYPGYAVGFLATCGVLALARPLIDDPPPPAQPGGDQLELRALAWRAAATGALAGLAVWQHPLYGWICATTLAAVAWRQRRLARSVLLPLVAGGVVALAPVVVTNLRHDLVSLRFRSPAAIAYPERVRAWVTDLYPRSVGAKWLDPGWVLRGPSQVLAVLLLATLLATCVAVVRWSPPSGKVAAGTLVLAPFTLTLLGNTAYTQDARYAAMVLPVAGLVVAHGVALLPPGWRTGRSIALVATAWALLAVALPLSRTDMAAFGDRTGEVDQLVDFLDARQITAVRADYWVAYRVVVESDERIAASPLDPIKFDRYEQRVRQADTDAGGAGVLVLDRDQAATYPAAVARGELPYRSFPQFQGHQQVEVSRWTVFLPPGPPAASTTGGG